MNPIVSYWKDIALQAFRRTAFFAWQRMVLGLIVTMVGFGLQWLTGLHPWNDIWKILLTVIGAYLIVMIAAYFTNIFRVPAILHINEVGITAKLMDDNESLRGTISKERENGERLTTDLQNVRLALQECEKRLAQHPDVLQEQRQLAIIRAKLKDFTAEEKCVLQYICDHGEILRTAVERELSGYKENVIGGAIGKGMSKALLKEETIHGSFDKWLSVTPNLKLALKTILTEKS